MTETIAAAINHSTMVLVTQTKREAMTRPDKMKRQYLVRQRTAKRGLFA